MNLSRHTALILSVFLLVFGDARSAVAMQATAPAPRTPDLQRQLDQLVHRALPGALGIAVLDLPSGVQWRANAEQAFPMMSVFKAPLAAAVLDQIERGEIAIDQTVTIKRGDLQSGLLRDDFRGERMQFSVRDLLTDAVSKSDNTAADALLQLVGGPAAVSAFLQRHGIKGMRVDQGEAGASVVFSGLTLNQQPPADETDAQQLTRRRRGYDAYLLDPRNRSSPDAAFSFLAKLWRSELLSPASTQRLIALMVAQTTPARLRAGLPPAVQLADKCGTSYTLENRTAAFNDIGILSWPDGHVVIVAAFLSGSTAPLNERNAIFADLARDVAATVHP